MNPPDRALGMVMPSPDWVRCLVTVDAAGPESLDGVRTNCLGFTQGTWYADFDRLEEQWLHTLLASRGDSRLTVEAARGLARRLRMVAEQQHDRLTGGGGAPSPFDPHRIAPLPQAILDQGCDAPSSLAAMFEAWGCGGELVHAREVPGGAPWVTAWAGANELRYRWAVEFYAPDWTPWRLASRLAQDHPTVKVTLRGRAMATATLDHMESVESEIDAFTLPPLRLSETSTGLDRVLTKTDPEPDSVLAPKPARRRKAPA